MRGVGSLPPSAGPEVTPRGVAVHDGDCARRGGEGFRAHDPEGIVEGHHLAATRAASGIHVIVAVRTPTFNEAVFPQLKEGHRKTCCAGPAILGVNRRYAIFLASSSHE